MSLFSFVQQWPAESIVVSIEFKTMRQKHNSNTKSDKKPLQNFAVLELVDLLSDFPTFAT